jgi:hypothetical protein
VTPARPIILALSDSTGITAEAAGKAALAQFGHQEEGAVRVIPSVRSVGALEDAVEKAREEGALLVYTLVEPRLRSAMKDLTARHAVPSVDLLGGLIRGLAEHLGRRPLAVPGLIHELDEEYFRRVAAVEFAVHHDDGKNPQNLQDAEIVIVGISRASKTPLSNYIAGRGVKVANVPIVMGVPLPRQIEDVDPRRVFSLTIDPVTLMKIRQARMQSLHMRPDSDYGDLRQIRREINHAKRVTAAHPGWTLVDMSRKAVEEAAAVILETWRRRFGRDDGEGGAAEGAPSPARRRAARKRKAAGTKRKAAKKKPAAAKRKAPKKKPGAAKRKAAAPRGGRRPRRG